MPRVAPVNRTKVTGRSLFGRWPRPRSKPLGSAVLASCSDERAFPGPCPVRNLPQGVKLGVVGRMGVLHRDTRAELNVFAHGRAERLIVRHAGGVDGRHIQLDEALTLLPGDLQATMDVNRVFKAQLAGEAVGATERLGGEHRQVINVLRLTIAEQRLEQGVAEHTVVEDLLELVESLLAASVLEQRRHGGPMLARARTSSDQAKSSCAEGAPLGAPSALLVAIGKM